MTIEEINSSMNSHLVPEILRRLGAPAKDYRFYIYRVDEKLRLRMKTSVDDVVYFDEPFDEGLLGCGPLTILTILDLRITFALGCVRDYLASQP